TISSAPSGRGWKPQGARVRQHAAAPPWCPEHDVTNCPMTSCSQISIDVPLREYLDQARHLVDDALDRYLPEVDAGRGRATCHKAFDEATAILAGDGLLTLAFELIAHEVEPVSAALRCVQILAEGAGPAGMVGGQMADLQAEQQALDERIDGSLCELEAIHRRKTGALLRAPLQMGAVIAHAPQAHQEALDHYGRAVGLAFQIVDDLLDVQGDETKLGKRVGKDSGLGKWTYPRFLGIDGSRRRAQQLADEAVAALAPLGSRGHRLRELALALLERDR